MSGESTVTVDARLLQPGTVFYDRMETKCVLAGWAAYRLASAEPDPNAVKVSDAVTFAVMRCMNDEIHAWAQHLADQGSADS